EIELCQVSLRLCRAEVGLGQITLVPPVVEIGLCHRVVLDQARVARELRFGILKLRPVLRDGSFRSPQVVLVRIALDGEEWLALLDDFALLATTLAPKPPHPG